MKEIKLKIIRKKKIFHFYGDRSSACSLSIKYVSLYVIIFIALADWLRSCNHLTDIHVWSMLPGKRNTPVIREILFCRANYVGWVCFMFLFKKRDKCLKTSLKILKLFRNVLLKKFRMKFKLLVMWADKLVTKVHTIKLIFTNTDR